MNPAMYTGALSGYLVAKPYNKVESLGGDLRLWTIPAQVNLTLRSFFKGYFALKNLSPDMGTFRRLSVTGLGLGALTVCTALQVVSTVAVDLAKGQVISADSKKMKVFSFISNHGHHIALISQVGLAAILLISGQTVFALASLSVLGLGVLDAHGYLPSKVSSIYQNVFPWVVIGGALLTGDLFTRVVIGLTAAKVASTWVAGKVRERLSPPKDFGLEQMQAILEMPLVMRVIVRIFGDEQSNKILNIINRVKEIIEPYLEKFAILGALISPPFATAAAVLEICLKAIPDPDVLI